MYEPKILNGYRLIYMPDHHKALKNSGYKGYVYEHIAVANKDLPLHFDLVDIVRDFGYTDNIEVIQTPDGVHIKTKQEK